MLPCVFIQLNGHQSILHCFVDQGVDTGHEEGDGTEQSLAIPTQQLLCFCIIPKLILQRKAQVLPANFSSKSHHKGSFYNTAQYLQLWGLLAEVGEGVS